ncbi:YceI family protein [Sphingomonas sp.]|uniref:YceI family protein n=1 Tax=Sphingomonas sp. TaxID=28214 RepID=UPI002DD67FF0|nr:YceI family protein [Sphingomonas sp.]
MRLPLVLIAATAIVAVPVVAQQAMQKPGSLNPALVTGGTYTADAAHSLIGWRVDHLGFNDYFGIFGDVAGTLTLDPKKPNAARVEVTIPVSKVTTASTGLTGHLLRAGKDGGKPDFFGPTPADAKFVSTSVTTQGQRAKITGNLTLNGVTRPVVLDAAFSGAGIGMNKKETVGFHATATIKRSEFGIGYAIPMVSDAVNLDVTAAFEK